MLRQDRLFTSCFVAIFGTAGITQAAYLTDTFDYADQSAFESAYEIDVVGSPAVDLQASEGTVRMTVNGGDQAGASNKTLFVFDAFTPMSVGGDIVTGGGFTPTRFGIEVADDPDTEVYVQLQARTTDTEIVLRRVNNGVNTFLNSVVIGDNANFSGTWLLEVGATDVSVRRNGNPILSAVHGLDFANYAGGAQGFFYARKNAAGSTAVTFDNFVIDGTAVPEPGAAMTLLGLGLASLRRHRG
ncbi:PEP-CTERM sorting domain-containing protein [Mucisphaera calidilacus]|uniref:Ice-binding protein C-terminal domain-containing protein n=1 Tax=Mucisphaera calidilacus TaxID=2527982 RepID=A0A518BZ57_9BACT|nr:PEP-CTERM sorting domain-containing protein [Mucisphaera calidilacus]QDU72260.1 hypothetical protein Pan265_21240 [Mucisphaera calidilacus]